MKVAIIGAPNAGKSELAKALQEAAQDKVKFDIVDDYVSHLSEETDTAYGHFAGYIGNFEVVFERLRQERISHLKNVNTITVGTVVDSMIYAAHFSQFAAANATNARAEHARASTTMNMFGMLVADTYDYDLTFYLPYSTEYRQEHEGEWDTLLDQEYISALIGINIGVVVLDGSDAENLAKALQAVFERANDEIIVDTTATPE